MKAKSRFWVAYFLEDLSVGTEFDHGRLHMTIVPWFVSDESDDEIIESFKKYFNGFGKLTVELGEKTVFGSKKKAPVTLAEANENLLNLHQETLKWMESVDGRWAVKDPHADSEYRPHIRHRRGKSSLPAELKVGSLSLIIASRQEDWQRKVVAKVNLE